MSATHPSSMGTEASAKPSRAPGPLGFLVRVALVFAAAMATVILFVVSIQEANDYSAASALKHRALAAHPHKIVLVGGSNLAYGVDSHVLEEATHCPVVNMGMNGFFGVRFMLEEVKPELHAGDVVVLGFEYDSYVKSIYGTSSNLLIVTKHSPARFLALTPLQTLNVIAAYPYVAQQKTMRLIDELRWGVNRLLGKGRDYKEENNPWDMSQVEVLSGFNANGDLTSHLKTQWPTPPDHADDLTLRGTDPDFFPLVESFVREMKQKGVRVIISYGPAERSFYEKHKAIIESWDKTYRSNPIFTVPRPASEFVFDASYHFDTAYHLNAKGRPIRSRMLAEDILKAIPDRPICQPESKIAQEQAP